MIAKALGSLFVCFALWASVGFLGLFAFGVSLGDSVLLLGCAFICGITALAWS